MNKCYTNTQRRSRLPLTMLLIALLALCHEPLFAQTKVSGKITDENKAPMAGVTILVQGKNTGTISGAKGEYSIAVQKGDTLVFSFIGYKTQKIAVRSGQTAVNLQMQPDAMTVDDVIVVGYGTQKRAHFAGAASSLNPESYKLDEIPADGLDKLLQGRMAGMMIQDKAGQVGVDAEIRIRGNASFSASSSPLLVIDGLPIEDGSLSDVNVNDIENIEVLKDAASTAIYGSRGAPGVIMITTKQGSKSKTQFNVKYQTGITNVMEYYDTYTLEEYAELYYRKNVLYPWETAYLSQGMEIPNGINEDGSFNVAPSGEKFIPYDKYFSTEINPATGTVYNKNGAGYAQMSRLNQLVGAVDPQRSVTQTGYSHKVSMSAQGGSDKINYYLSAAYANETGVMVKNGNQSISMSANIQARVHPKVKVDLKLSPRYKKTNVSSSAQLGGALRWLTHPLTYDEKTLLMVTPGSGGVPADVALGDYTKSRDFRNIYLVNEDFTDYVLDSKGKKIPISTYSGTGDVTSYALAMDSEDLRKEYALNGNLGVTWNIIKGLDFRSTLGAYAKVNNKKVWKGSYTNSKGKKTRGDGSATYSNSIYTKIVNENTLNYKTSFGNHNLNALAGFSLESSVNESLQAMGDDFPVDNIQTLNYAGLIVAKSTTSNRIEETLVSTFFRLNYNFKEKYMLSAVYRADGSSQFGPGNRWGSFPSVSAAWRITEEPFMKNVKWLSDLKLRASYGISGNNNITNYSYITKVSKVIYPMDDDVVDGYAPAATLGNSMIGWEQTNSGNIGLSMGFLDNRITMNIDVYRSKTKALLLEVPTSFVSGFNEEWANIGKMQNQGLEIELNTVNIQSKNFLWTMNANFSTSSSHLLDYGGQERETFTGYKGAIYQLQVGRPLGEYYGYKCTGEIWRSAEEIEAAKAAGLALDNTLLGDPKFQDTNNDGKITEDDRVALGQSTPTIEWGWSNTFRFYGFDVSFMLQGAHGAKVWNMTNAYGGNYLRNIQDGIYVDEFHGSKPLFGNDNVYASDYFIEDASYIALRNLSIGYSIPKTKIRVYVAGRNLLYFMSKNYNGINPEFRANNNGDFTPEQRMTVVPLMRTFSAGIDIKF